MPQFGTFGGKFLGHKSTLVTRKIDQTNSSAIRATTDTGRYAQKDNPLMQTPRGSGLSATSGDSPVSHVTPDPVSLTPEYASRYNGQWEGNITGNTVSKDIKQKNAVLHYQPRMGFGRGGIVPDAARHDAAIPTLVSGQSNGVPTHNPSGKDLSSINFTTTNPEASQNQDPNPRVRSLTQGA